MLKINAFRWTKVMRCFGIVLSPLFLVQKCKKKPKFLKKIRVLSAVFFRNDMHVISKRQADLEKKQTPEFMLVDDYFCDFFKLAHLPHFQYI